MHMISDLIKILIDKNENNSSFKYDDLIDDIDLENATNIYIPQIDYSYNLGALHQLIQHQQLIQIQIQ